MQNTFYGNSMPIHGPIANRFGFGGFILPFALGFLTGPLVIKPNKYPNQTYYPLPYNNLYYSNNYYYPY